MAASATAGLLSRLINLRNAVRSIGNHANIAPNFNSNLSLVTKRYSVDANAMFGLDEGVVKPKKKLSKAMRAYLERAKEHDEFMKKEITEYEIGKRHLANMMGENPDTFTQKDVNRSIKYLFPSALYDPKARPIMETPDKIFPAKKAAQFDETGRPYHTLFYTCKPNFYQILHDIVKNLNELNEFEDKSVKKGILPRPEDRTDLVDSEWLPKDELEQYLLESLTDEQYGKYVAAAQRLLEHPYSSKIEDFLVSLRKRKVLQSAAVSIPECKYTTEGRPYITVHNCRRKSAEASVTVFGKGEGKITINGEDIRYFNNLQSREQSRKKCRGET